MRTQAQGASYYRRMRKLASLCDRAGKREADHEVRRTLGEIFARSARREFEDYSDLLLLTVSEDELGLANRQLEELASALLVNELADEHFGQLDRLGSTLHRETAHALARLRSS